VVSENLGYHHGNGMGQDPASSAVNGHLRSYKLGNYLQLIYLAVSLRRFGEQRISGLAPDLGLDHIQLCNPVQRLCGECCRPRRVQVVELAPRVRPARRFADHAVVEQGIEPRIRIGL